MSGIGVFGAVSYPPQIHTGSGEAVDTLLEQLYVLLFPA